MPTHVQVVTGPAGPTKVFLKRAALGLSQTAFAEKLGIERSRLSQIERGKVWPKGEEIERMAEAFDVPFGELAEWLREMRAAAKTNGTPEEATP